MCGKLIDDKVLVLLSCVDEPPVEEVQHHRYLLDSTELVVFPGQISAEGSHGRGGEH